jgi:hypothetical protein
MDGKMLLFGRLAILDNLATGLGIGKICRILKIQC